MIVEPELSFEPHDVESERASNSYLMSVMALIVGLPLPIVNLVATFIFYMSNRRATFFVRWHCTQALLSQATVLVMNSAGMWWTLHILFHEMRISNLYIGYMITVFVFNLSEFILTIYTAIQTRKGIHVEWWFWGGLTNRLCKV
ncbi:hypothetical protein OAL15_02110 [Flavobacteriales bacterium]|nr:hypothetical protein [Flavobacteriales bacterium]